MATASALAIVLALQCERVFVPTMIFVVDQSNRAELSLNAAVVFLAIALGAVLVRALGIANAAIVSSIVLVICRFAIQFTDRPGLRWQIASLGLMASGWLLIALANGDRDALAVGIALGFWLDLTLRAGFDTIDLTYMTNFSKDAISVVLFGLLLFTVLCLELPEGAAEPGWFDSLPLIGIGAGIGSYALISGNLGLAAVRTGHDPQYSLWLLSLGPVAAIALWMFPIRVSSIEGLPLSEQFIATAAVVLMGAIGLAGIATPLEGHGQAALVLVLFSFASTYLTMLAAKGRRIERDHPWVWRTGLLVTLGMCIHAATTFLYFAGSGSFFYAVVAYLALGTAALIAAGKPASWLPVNYGRYLAPAALATCAFVVALVASGTEAVGGASAELDSDLTVVTYNIQNGFSRDNVWDLEATARTIESLEPDIVLLQETGRGWFALGWADQVWWFSQRLDMEFAFGPASHDDLWGNTILSSAPLLGQETLKYASTQNLNRSAVSVQIPFASGELWVASTHLDNPSGAGEVRMDQTNQLLGLWNEAQPAVIGGDFNAIPDSDVVAAMTSTGLIDSAAAAGNPETTSESGNRIDYVFVTPDLEVVSVDVPDIWTSDHRPVQVLLRIPGG